MRLGFSSAHFKDDLRTISDKGRIPERRKSKMDLNGQNGTGSLVDIHVNLYGMSVSFTDCHPFKLFTGVHLKSYGL